jgi:hypothetical protein
MNTVITDGKELSPSAKKACTECLSGLLKEVQMVERILKLFTS